MPEFHYYHPIVVRYGDLDPQGHVNNAKYLTYFEQARLGYLQRLGLWDAGSFLRLGIILADAQVTFRSPALFNQPLRAGAAVTRLGNKSFTMAYNLENTHDGRCLATATSVLVTYDYSSHQSIPIPPAWRAAITAFDHL